MATKNATILARVELEVKEQAEEILSKLGVPVSIVINMLYKQIIMTKSIPFPLSLPKEPPSLNSLTTEDLTPLCKRDCHKQNLTNRILLLMHSQI